MLQAILVSYVGLSLLCLFIIWCISLLDWFARWRNLRTSGCQFHRLLMFVLPSLLPCWSLLSLKAVRSAILASSYIGSSISACFNTMLAFSEGIWVAGRIHHIMETSFACCGERICSFLSIIEVVKVSRRLLCFCPTHFGWAFVTTDGAAAAVSLLNRGHLI